MSGLRTAAQQALEALKMMRDQYEEYACPACDHADAAIYALRAALTEDAMQKFTDVNQELMAALGCDHCNHPLYAATRCRVCGRVTEPVREPVKQCMAHGECFGGECIYQRPAEPVQEPYAWMAVGGTIWRHKTSEDDVPLYTTPRVPLAEWQINDLMADIDPEDRDSWSFRQGVYAAEKHHGVRK